MSINYKTTTILVLVSVIAVFVFHDRLFLAARHIDKHYLGEGMKDIRARLMTSENWHDATAHEDYNYAWLYRFGRPVRIAHALGTPGQGNTIEAFMDSRAKGFHLFEVDIWLDGTGDLRCHHGPKPPAPLMPGDCTLPVLLGLLRDDDYLVLDIKTPFRETFAAILAQGGASPAIRQVIVQLYQPQHIALFRDYADLYALPGPVVTAYQGQRSLKHIYASLGPMGIKAFTVPYPRLPALDKRGDDVRVLTHPLKSCDDFDDALRAGADGAYVPNTLSCHQGRK